MGNHDLVVTHQPDGPHVEIVANVDIAGLHVGLIAYPRVTRGWVELTPDEARAVARALVRAADETGRTDG
jgi:hypothetical protein